MANVIPTVPSNWAGNVRFAASGVAVPASLSELQQVVGNARRIRVIGTGHSFSPLADTTGLQLSLRRLVAPVDIVESTGEAWVSAGATYTEVTEALDASGWALANLASLPSITVGGATATATHGSGVTNQVLSAGVTGLELVDTDGSLVSRSGEDLPGAAVSLGALGVVIRLRLAIEPRFEMAQHTWLDVPLAGVLERLDEVLALGWSVSLFTDWMMPDVISQVWVKDRLDATRTTPGGDELLAAIGGRRAHRDVHPIAGADPAAATSQLGVVGPWHARLPHFRPTASPSGAGAELQSEWLVPSNHGAAALDRMRGLAGRLAPALLVCEVRAVAADELWLSPAYRRDSVAIHFTWRPDPARVTELIAVVEEALAPWDPRPHWAKLWTAAPRLPRAADFRALATAMDPERRFANDFVERYLLDAD